jgi:HlyD family secretion protein
LNRRLVLLLVLIMGGGVFAGWRWFPGRTAAPVAWQGYAEADFVKIGPMQQGLLTAVHVARGDKVAAQAPLFDQDATGDLAARDQAKHQLDQAEQQLANLQSAGKPTEIAHAQATLAADQAARDKLAADLARNENLLKTGSAAAQLVDQEHADLRTAEAKLQGDQAMLAQAQAPMGRDREISAQQAAMQAAQSALQMAQWRLDQRHVVAPVAGTIADVLAEPGETLAAGSPVVSLLPPANIFVRFFVPETALANVHLGDKVGIACDNCPKDLQATISFIAPQAEYTPPVIYSDANRSKLVYLVEAHPSAQQAERINPGQPVTVHPIEKASPS